jgi:hypothetical protein
MKNTLKQPLLAGLMSSLMVSPALAESGVEVGAAIELEANSAGEATVSEVEAGIAGDMGAKITYEAVLLYEAGAGTSLDSASVTIGTEEAKLNYTVGLIFVPFGNFATGMLSDPLTLELGETSETALQIGYKATSMDIDFYLFPGSVSAAGSNLGYGLNLGKNSKTTQMGIGYISNIGDSNSMQEQIDINAGGTVAAGVAGLNIYFVNENDKAFFVFEYLMALATFQAGEVGASAVSPTTMNIEYGRKTKLMGKDSKIAIGYQTTEQASDLVGQKSRLMTAVTMELNSNSAIGFEFAIDTDYASVQSNNWTLQYVYEF